ncbi:MAG: hypothetical protein AAGI46_15580 [Planctomycetota bacterium]
MFRVLPFLVAAVLSLLVASAARGQDFVFSIDPIDGHTMIESDVPFRGFSLQSDTDALLPENLPFILVNNPFLIVLSLDPLLVLPNLGTFVSNITAGTTGTPIPPGTYDLGPIVDIATLDFSTEFGGLSLSYLPADTDELLPGQISIPEPTSSLLAYGVLGLALLRRRRSA